MNDVCVLLQARMSSVRLPGKSTKLIAGYPLAVLSAFRAGNTGRRVVVVTSTDESDDVLYDTVISYGIECMRGNLENVLSRFNHIAEDLNLNKNSLIVRITGDNIVPDGRLIDDLIDAYKYHLNIDYIGANHPTDNLPYGVNVELFSLVSLREAYSNATTQYDLEHVTPWIKRHYKSKGMSEFLSNLNYEYITCDLNLTIDSSEEFNFMKLLFLNVNNPVTISWKDLCKIAFFNLNHDK